jgi:hypothetical protein
VSPLSSVHIACLNNPSSFRLQYYLAGDYVVIRTCDILYSHSLLSLIRKSLVVRLLPAVVLLYLKLLSLFVLVIKGVRISYFCFKIKALY